MRACSTDWRSRVACSGFDEMLPVTVVSEPDRAVLPGEPWPGLVEGWAC